MNPSARLQATLELLTDIAATPKPADALVSAYFRARRYIGSKDRAAVAAHLYSILRHHARVHWWLDHYTLEPSPRAQLLVYLVLADKVPTDEIERLFSGGKFAPVELSLDEKTFIRKLATRTLEHPHMPDAVVGECPDWAAPALQEKFGAAFLTEMQAMMGSAPLDLRVNPLKATREAMLIEFKKLRLKARAGRLSPYAIRLDDRPSLATLPMLKNGQVEIQDEGSQLVALLVDARPGQRVVDFCAGAGGKTLAIAAEMNNKGRVIACDVLDTRLKRSTERFRRAGLHNIEVKPLSSERDPWVKRHKLGFDRVLVDAPCSGTGTWRRNPDARWRTLGPGLDALLALQASILASASRLVKGGGRLVYATCSMLPQENERQIETFLAAHPDFSVVSYKNILPDTPSAHADYLSLTPAQHHTDGFFAAVMERKATVANDKDEEGLIQGT